MLKLKTADDPQYIKKKLIPIIIVNKKTGKNKLVIIRFKIQLGLGKSGLIIPCG